MKLHRPTIAMLGLASVISPRSISACTRVSGPPVKVKTTFVVFVHDPSGKPLSRAEIRVNKFIRNPPHSELVASALTNKDGKAEIRGLHDNYSIAARLNAVSSEIIQVDVYDDGSGVSGVSLAGPGGPITQIQNVSGILGEGSSSVPWVGALVELRGPSGEDEKKYTDSHGRFEFGEVAPGFYALHVKDPNAETPARFPQLEGDVAIACERMRRTSNCRLGDLLQAVVDFLLTPARTP